MNLQASMNNKFKSVERLELDELFDTFDTFDTFCGMKFENTIVDINDLASTFFNVNTTTLFVTISIAVKARGYDITFEFGVFTGVAVSNAKAISKREEFVTFLRRFFYYYYFGLGLIGVKFGVN